MEALQGIGALLDSRDYNKVNQVMSDNLVSMKKFSASPEMSELVRLIWLKGSETNRAIITFVMNIRTTDIATHQLLAAPELFNTQGSLLASATKQVKSKSIAIICCLLMFCLHIDIATANYQVSRHEGVTNVTNTRTVCEPSIMVRELVRDNLTEIEIDQLIDPHPQNLDCVENGIFATNTSTLERHTVYRVDTNYYYFSLKDSTCYVTYSESVCNQMKKLNDKLYTSVLKGHNEASVVPSLSTITQESNCYIIGQGIVEDKELIISTQTISNAAGYFTCQSICRGHGLCKAWSYNLLNQVCVTFSTKTLTLTDTVAITASVSCELQAGLGMNKPEPQCQFVDVNIKTLKFTCPNIKQKITEILQDFSFKTNIEPIGQLSMSGLVKQELYPALLLLERSVQTLPLIPIKLKLAEKVDSLLRLYLTRCFKDGIICDRDHNMIRIMSQHQVCNSVNDTLTIGQSEAWTLRQCGAKNDDDCHEIEIIPEKYKNFDVAKLNENITVLFVRKPGNLTLVSHTDAKPSITNMESGVGIITNCVTGQIGNYILNGSANANCSQKSTFVPFKNEEVDYWFENEANEIAQYIFILFIMILAIIKFICCATPSGPQGGLPAGWGDVTNSSWQPISSNPNISEQNDPQVAGLIIPRPTESVRLSEISEL